MSLIRASLLVGPLVIALPGRSPQHVMPLGRSLQRRPIVAVEVVAPRPRATALVVGAIHGDEPAGIEVARAIRRAGPIPGIDLWVIDDLNPDGVAAHARQNADRVDLNRNFPWHWRRAGRWGDQQYPGVRALSEPRPGWRTPLSSGCVRD